MSNRSQKFPDVMKPAREISMKAAGRLDLVCTEQRPRQNRSGQGSFPVWKKTFLEAVLKALAEPDKELLSELLQATEQAINVRARDLLNCSEHHEELGEMRIALASMLSIKTLKLGWPAVSARDGLG
ncbi:MAG: hypothetical protein WAK78_05710 [Candidatus Acidiferrales bacterium]